TPFHTARDNLITAIEQKRALITGMLTQLRNLLSVIAQFDKYLARITKDHVPARAMRFYPRATVTKIVADAQAATLTPDEVLGYRFYLDDIPAMDKSLASTAPAAQGEIDGRFEEIQ